VDVLVVDDDPVVLELVAEQLSERGLSVATADGVQAALEHLEDRAPDIVLADIRMSPLDGYELLAEVQKATLKLTLRRPAPAPKEAGAE